LKFIVNCFSFYIVTFLHWLRGKVDEIYNWDLSKIDSQMEICGPKSLGNPAVMYQVCSVFYELS